MDKARGKIFSKLYTLRRQAKNLMQSLFVAATPTTKSTRLASYNDSAESPNHSLKRRADSLLVMQR